MTDSQQVPGQVFKKTVVIHCPVDKVWNVLTHPVHMRKWMAETEIEVLTEWKVGGPFVIRGPWYKTHFVNNGMVLAFEPHKHLRYSHLSSLSRLPDAVENYTIIDFELSESEDRTALTLTASNFPTEAIYKHIAFYWNVTMELLKKFVEGMR